MIKMGIPQVIALGTNEKVHADINALFEQREDEYNQIMEQAKESGKLRYIATFSVRYTNALMKAHAIVYLAFEEDNTQVLLPIMKKAYLPLYKAFNESNDYYDFKKVQGSVNPSGEFLGVTAMEVLSVYAALAYFNSFYYPPKITPQASQEINIFTNNFLGAIGSSLKEYDEIIDYKTQKISKEERKTISYLYEKYAINKEFNLPSFVERVAEFAVQESEYWEKLNRQTSRQMIAKIYDEILETDNGIAGLCYSIREILSRFGFFENRNTYRLNEKETKKLFILTAQRFHRAQFEEPFTVELILLGIVPALQMRKEYDDAIELYYEATSNELEEELKEKYEQKYVELRKEVTKLSNQLATEKERVSSLKLQRENAEILIKVKDKELAALREMQENYESLKQEVNALRDYSYRNANPEVATNDEALTLDEMVAYLDKQNLVIVGGNPKWQQKIKELLPSVKFIAIDKKNSYEALKTPNTIIVINTLANKHANYEKMLSMRNKSNPICYFNEHTNKGLSIQQLYEVVTYHA